MTEYGLHSNWRALSTVHINHKVFLAEGSQTQLIPNKTKTQKHGIDNVTASEVTEFYQELIKTPCLPKQEAKRTNGKTPQRSSHKKVKFERNIFFRAAMNNDVSTLENMDYTDDDLNSKDNFGWTAPMMAACEGSEAALICLERLGANIQLGDSFGNTPLSLARRKGYDRIVRLIIASEPQFQEASTIECVPVEFESFYCELCKREFRETSRRDHKTSTAHLFNCKAPKRKTSRYNIPSSNRGLKLMVKQGWDKDSGLGPKQDGNLYPVKTVIRKQRTGIGIKQDEPKVTHFKPYDLAAIKYRAPPPAGKTRNEMRREQQRNQRTERILRRELS